MVTQGTRVETPKTRDSAQLSTRVSPILGTPVSIYPVCRGRTATNKTRPDPSGAGRQSSLGCESAQDRPRRREIRDAPGEVEDLRLDLLEVRQDRDGETGVRAQVEDGADPLLSPRVPGLSWRRVRRQAPSRSCRRAPSSGGGHTRPVRSPGPGPGSAPAVPGRPPPVRAGHEGPLHDRARPETVYRLASVCRRPGRGRRQDRCGDGGSRDGYSSQSRSLSFLGRYSSVTKLIPRRDSASSSNLRPLRTISWISRCQCAFLNQG